MAEYLSETEKVQLETLVDKGGLEQVLGVLAYICWEKAEHIRTNWQDEPLAKEWDAAGNKVESLHRKIWPRI